ncbi:d21daca3-95fb-4dda-a27d-b11729d3bfc2 [Sclerotinia trifoliorum]|uniref:D21daca3-95fb-4dda-a27d-b11729d3bfc2 n=1 Tax=Sclerotinia trifoliorum TaxID=28548 RepID=A0A8H2VN29_9HELO|nr:d21daca3-95fb-4dda-a27d-b11729d3bfc2 [Sclerotinia trifoliorum]
MLNQEFLVSVDPQGPGDGHVLEDHIIYRSHVSETIVKYMMEKIIKFSESRRLKDGFPSWPGALYYLLFLLADNLRDRRGTHTSTATISFISALLEMRVDIHLKNELLGSPLSRIVQSDVLENLPLLIITWFELLRKFDYDLQDYILKEWEYYQRCIIDPLRDRGFWYMHIFHARKTANIICKFECYDYCHHYRNMFSQTRQNRMPGAWEDDVDGGGWSDHVHKFLHDEVTVSKIRRPRRSPDFEMSFEIGPLIDGEQNFSHKGSLLRRMLSCYCEFFMGWVFS